MRRDKPEFPAAIETAYPKWETFLTLLKELEETYADRNFYKLKSEGLEASLEDCRELGKKEIEKLQLALIARDAWEEKTMSKDLVEILQNGSPYDVTGLYMREAAEEIIKLRLEKTLGKEQRDGLIDQNIKLRADNELLKKEIKAAAVVLIEQQGRLNALEYQGQDK